METLAHSINQDVERKEWKAVRVARGAPRVSHLFLFGKASMTQARVMQQILEKFFGEPGQKINLSKSKIWYLPTTACSLIQAITGNFGIPSTSDLGVYLGMPLFHGRIQGKHFQYLTEKNEVKDECMENEIVIKGL